MEQVFKFLFKIPIYLVTSLILFYATLFYVGSEETYTSLVKVSKLKFIFGRLFLNLIVSLVLLLFFTSILLLCKKLINGFKKLSIRAFTKNFIVFSITLSVILVLFIHVI